MNTETMNFKQKNLWQQLAWTDYLYAIILLTGGIFAFNKYSHFMDAYEDHVLGDLKHLGQDELQELYVKVSEQFKASRELLSQPGTDYRKSQDSSGKLRLAGLFKEAITKELKERFGTEPDIH